MFVEPKSETWSRQPRVLAGSLALHGLLFAWLLHAPEPLLLNPTSIALGRNGRVLTQLYWPSQTPDDSSTSSSDHATEVYRHQRLGHEKLTWKRISTSAKLPLPNAPLPPSGVEDNAKVATLSRLGHGATAGLPFGNMPRQALCGDAILPG